jgi:hypothetical protein
MNKPTIRRSTKSVLGTSFHGHTVKATRAQLKKALGNPQYVNLDCTEKVQHEWVLEIAGHVFTVYDWKEGRWNKLSDPIEWHIGADSVVVSDYAHRELSELLEK